MKISENVENSPSELGTSLRASGVQCEASVTTSHPRSVSEENEADDIEVQRHISEYRSRAHTIAKIDQLGIRSAEFFQYPCNLQMGVLQLQRSQSVWQSNPQHSLFRNRGMLLVGLSYETFGKNIHSINRAMRSQKSADQQCPGGVIQRPLP